MEKVKECISDVRLKFCNGHMFKFDNCLCCLNILYFVFGCDQMEILKMLLSCLSGHRKA